MNSHKTIIISLAVLLTTAAGITGYFVGKSQLGSNLHTAEETPTTAPEQNQPTATTPSPSPQLPPTTTITPTPITYSYTFELTDSLSKNKFNYRVKVPFKLKIQVSKSGAFKSAKLSTPKGDLLLTIEQAYEAYPNHFKSVLRTPFYNPTFGKLRWIETADGSIYLTQKVETRPCESLGDKIPAPCGLPAITSTISGNIYLANFKCEKAKYMDACTSIVKGLNIK